MKPNRTSTLKEIIEAGGEEILKKNGVPCVTCPMASFEINQLQIGQVSEIYHLDLKKILKDLEEIGGGK